MDISKRKFNVGDEVIVRTKGLGSLPDIHLHENMVAADGQRACITKLLERSYSGYPAYFIEFYDSSFNHLNAAYGSSFGNGNSWVWSEKWLEKFKPLPDEIIRDVKIMLKGGEEYGNTKNNEVRYV